MPNYQYLCSNEDCTQRIFDTHQSIHDAPLVNCPLCQQSIQRVIHSPRDVFVNGEPKTLGVLAEQNRKRLGESYCQEKEQQMREERLNASEFKGKLPTGASVGEKRVAHDTWWRKANEPVDLSLATMTPEKTEKYIMTGKK
jgi:putative FmdB family regulatory protein